MNYPGAKTEENFRPKTRTVKRSGISNMPLRFLWQIQIGKIKRRTVRLVVSM